MTSTITDEITAVSEMLEQEIGPQKYRIWFKNSTRMSIEKGYLRVVVPSPFIANWIEKHFADVIRKVLKQVDNSYEDVIFVVDPAIAGHSGNFSSPIPPKTRNFPTLAGFIRCSRFIKFVFKFTTTPHLIQDLRFEFQWV